MNHSPMTVRVRPAARDDRARWNGFVDRSADASVYHRYEWGEIFQRAYGTRFRPLLAEREGRVVGVLPLVSLSRGPLGRRLVSVPYFGHGGVLADGPDAWDALLGAALSLARERGTELVELRHAHPTPELALPARTDKVLMQLALPESVAAFEKSLGGKLRADVRRPQREGLRAEVGGRELLPAFHEAYARVMRDLGSPCHAPELFDEIMARMPERTFVVRVLYQGRTAGAALLVGQGAAVEVPCAGTLHALNKLRANMLLYWTAITTAIERGYRTFSFGRSTIDAGTYAFKKQWGALPIPLPYHYLLGSRTEAPRPHKDNGALARASELWTRLPLALTNALGPHLARRLE